MISENKIYCVVVTYNGEGWIENCLRSLLYGSQKDISVVVVDNCSTDATLTIIEHIFPDVYIIKNKENKGFGQANNQGIIKALALGASHLFLLNQDACIEHGALIKLADALVAAPAYGILSPIHFNGNGSALDHGFKYYITRAYSSSLAGQLEKGQHGAHDIFPIPFVNAAAWMISRECMEKVGLFHPVFFHYGEDLNFCNRVLFHGFKVGIVPNAKIFHDRRAPGEFNEKEALSALKTVPLNAALDLRKSSIFAAYLHATKKIAELGFEGLKLFSVKVCSASIKRWLNLVLHVRIIRDIRRQSRKPYPDLIEYQGNERQTLYAGKLCTGKTN